MLPELKPYLTALALPPTSLLIFILIGALLIRSNPKLAKRIIFFSVTTIWLISTNAFSVWFHNQVIPEYPLVTAIDLEEKSVQAIVVLGGGVVVGLPGGDQQLNKSSLERLRLGAQLARQSGLPLVFSGGSGWGAKDASVAEADVAEKVLQDAFGIKLNYKESRSRDTQENAAYTKDLLSKDGIQRIALVTSSTHLSRSGAEFKKIGFEVTVAAIGQPTASSEAVLRWMPRASDLEISQQILRELLATLIQKLDFPRLSRPPEPSHQ
jgi:uncharacterized SAM-binding protein YcdF (DUF218 family)